jgi:serine/threonine protein kinase
MIGKTISHYKILEKLGEGGMGVVYNAHDTKLDRDVALKFLSTHLIANETEKKRFLQEAQAAARLNHPNICMVFEVDEVDGQSFIAMELVEGQTLKEKIKTGPLDIKEVLNISIQIAEGLSEAHEKGIIHRDIKSANILISPKGRVKIMDFGLAKLAGQVGLTKTRSTAGTVAYMSPEQIQGQEVDARTDIWSLGVILYEMLTGKLPFQGDYEQAVIYSILNEDAESISKLRRKFPDQLEKIVTKSMNKILSDRYQEMHALRSDLQTFKKHMAMKLYDDGDEEILSIAVLPFVNISADPENEYFSDGLTEELINALTRLKDFRIVARTSAFAFKGKQVDIREIGDQLNVQYVLEGSVRKSGKRIRITAQLISIKDGYHLWSEKYDRDLEDVFSIQDEISIEIAEKLQSEFIQTSPKVSQGTLPDLGTYELYLRGRYYFNKFSPEWMLRAQAAFSEAIACNPSFALAHAGLADTYVILTNPIGLLDARESLPKAQSAAEEALRLDPNLSEAYAALGAVATFLDWEIDKAQALFEKAIELNPNNVNTLLWYELALSLLAQDYDRALRHLSYALEIDPLNLLILLRTGYLYVYKYQYETAIKYFKKIISIEPEVVSGHHGLVDVYGLQGRYDLVFSEGEIVRKLSNEGPPFLAVLALYYGRSGKRKEAKVILSTLLKRYQSEPVSPFWIGVIYMGLEEFNEMYAWFDRAFEKHDSNLLYTFAPPFDPIRKDPKFIALRNKMDFKR